MSRQSDMQLLKLLSIPFIIIIGIFLIPFRIYRALYGGDKKKPPITHPPARPDDDAQGLIEIYAGTGTSLGTRVGYVENGKIFSGNRTGGGEQIGYIEGPKVFSGVGTSLGSQVGYVDANRVYTGSGTSLGRQVGYVDGKKVFAGEGTSLGRQVGYADDSAGRTSGAAALLLLLK